MANTQINPLTFYDGAPFNANDLNMLQQNITAASTKAELANTTANGKKEFGVIRTGTVVLNDLKADVPQKASLNFGNFEGGTPYIVASPFLSEPLDSKHHLTVTVVGVGLGSSPFIYVTSSKAMSKLTVSWIAAKMMDAS